MKKDLPNGLSFFQHERPMEEEEKYSELTYPQVSVIIPTYNRSESISQTIESLINQDYPDLEIIIIDGGSKDRTIETIKGFRAKNIRFFTVKSTNRYEMLNKGISHARGLYLNFLFPGDTYLHPKTPKIMMNLALDSGKPPFLYCGVLLRVISEEPKFLYRAMTIDNLKLGLQPTSLQGCWVRTDQIRKMGKFSPSYTLRGGFELICRLVTQTDVKPVSIPRILIDCDLQPYSRQSVSHHFFETIKTIYHYFGFWYAYKWLFKQRDIARYLQICCQSVKRAFLGP